MRELKLRPKGCEHQKFTGPVALKLRQKKPWLCVTVLTMSDSMPSFWQTYMIFTMKFLSNEEK